MPARLSISSICFFILLSAGAYGGGVFVFHQRVQQKTKPVVIATRKIDPRNPVAIEDLEVVKYPVSAVKKSMASDPSVVVGKYLTKHYYPNQAVFSDDVLPEGIKGFIEIH